MMYDKGEGWENSTAFGAALGAILISAILIGLAALIYRLIKRKQMPSVATATPLTAAILAFLAMIPQIG